LITDCFCAYQTNKQDGWISSCASFLCVLFGLDTILASAVKRRWGACLGAPCEARRGPGAFISLRHWISMRYPPRRVPCEWVQGAKASACLKFFLFCWVFLFFKMIYVLTYLSIFLIYHKKQLRGIFVKNKD